MSDNSIYVSLQRLLWSTFIGVLSFQVILPFVWGYANRFIGMPYEQAYWIFVIFYVLLLPVLFLTWIWRNWDTLRTSLFPFGTKGSVQGLCRVLLYGVTIVIAVETLISLATIGWGVFSYETYIAFVLLGGIVCLFSMVIGFMVSWKRIVSEPAITVDDQKTLKLTFYRNVSILTLLFVVLTTFLGYYISAHGKESYVLDRAKLNVGFQLLRMNDAIEEVKDKVVFLENHRKDVQRRDTLFNLVYGRQPDKNRKNIFLNDPSLRSLLTMGDSSYTAVRNVSVLLEEDSTFQEKAAQSAWHSWGHWESYKDRNPYATFARSASLPAYEPEELKVISSYFESIRHQTHQVAQKSLGLQLRDTQLKLMVLLVTLFFTVLALYIFLTVDNDIKNTKLTSLVEKKRVRLVWPAKLKSSFEQRLIEAENESSSSRSMLDSVWLYLTIAVWLVVPLFKEVEDDKIDVHAPFRMLTMSKPPSSWSEGDNSFSEQYVNSFNTHQLPDTTKQIIFTLQQPSKLDTVFLYELMKQVRQNVGTVVVEVGKVKASSESIQRRVNFIQQDSN